VGTYLREIHQDFGGPAIFVFPFALGLSIAFLEVRGRGPVSVVLLSFLYVVVAYSFDINYAGTGGGLWYFPLSIALLIIAVIKPRRTQKNSVAAPLLPAAGNSTVS
jgi:peptidoglycan/LPS O-acetylase OafA/YrhL